MLVTSLANIFFYYLSVFFFILFMVSFAVQKVLCLIRVPFVYFCFYFHDCRRWIQKDTAVIYIKECSVFSS